MISGVLKFDNPGAVPSGQRIVIYLQDTSRVGASSVNMAQTTVTIPEDFDVAADDLPFDFNVMPDGDGLTLRAHMPMHEGDDVRSGDMVTTASTPASGDHPVNLTLRRV